MTVEAARRELEQILQLFAFLNDPPELFSKWQELVVTHSVQGKPAHDARIVAAMNVHSIDTLLTFNRVDFARSFDITILSPEEVAA